MGDQETANARTLVITVALAVCLLAGILFGYCLGLKVAGRSASILEVPGQIWKINVGDAGGSLTSPTATTKGRGNTGTADVTIGKGRK